MTSAWEACSSVGGTAGFSFPILLLSSSSLFFLPYNFFWISVRLPLAFSTTRLQWRQENSHRVGCVSLVWCRNSFDLGLSTHCQSLIWQRKVCFLALRFCLDVVWGTHLSWSSSNRFLRLILTFSSVPCSLRCTRYTEMLVCLFCFTKEPFNLYKTRII